MAAIFATPRGAQMLAALESRRFLFFFKTAFVVDLRVSNNAYAYPGGNAVYIDPSFHPVIQTTSGPIPATTQRIIAHELGHAVFSMADTGPGRMINVNINENPIMNSLGQPSRTRY
jgi:hypothetical protein